MREWGRCWQLLASVRPCLRFVCNCYFSNFCLQRITVISRELLGALNHRKCNCLLESLCRLTLKIHDGSIWLALHKGITTLCGVVNLRYLYNLFTLCGPVTPWGLGNLDPYSTMPLLEPMFIFVNKTLLSEIKWIFHMDSYSNWYNIFLVNAIEMFVSCRLICLGLSALSQANIEHRWLMI